MFRRGFLAGVGSTLAALACPSSVFAAPAKERWLWLVRSQTGESLRAPFCLDGRHVYLPGYERICWALRDVRVPAERGYVPFSIATIEALWEIQQMLASQRIERPIVITSGYRTPETNAATEGAARNSQHLHATAVDMYVDGVSMEQLFADCYERAISGGIGYYDDHIHLDTGPRRYWSG